MKKEERKMFYKFGDTKKRVPYICSLGYNNTDETIFAIKRAIPAGADGFLIHTEKMKEEYKDDENLKKIFSSALDKPVLALAYRGKQGETEDDRAKYLLRCIDCGAASIDVMSDFYDPQEEQFTWDKEAVRKQTQLIDEAHKRGADVLMSTHAIKRMLPLEQIIKQAKEAENRGADIVKIVLRPNSFDEVTDGLVITRETAKAINKPLLLILGGNYGKATRITAPLFGSCMVLCVETYDYAANTDKPLLSEVKAVYDNIDLAKYKAFD